MPIHSAIVPSVYGRCIARASDRWRAAAAGGSAARSGRRSRRQIDDLGVQSIGSSELMRNVTSASTHQRAQQSTSDEDGVEIAAVRTEVHAGQRDLLEPGAAATRATSRTSASIGRLLPAPRVVGMMQ